MTRLLRSFVMHCAHSRQRGALLQLSRSLQRHGREALFRGEENYRKSIALNQLPRLLQSRLSLHQGTEVCRSCRCGGKGAATERQGLHGVGQSGVCLRRPQRQGKSGQSARREIACWKRGSEQPARRRGAVEPGLLYAKKKLREQAISRIQSALALSPDDTTVLEAVGQAYEDLGDRAQALQYIEKSIQKGYALAI